MRDNPKLLKFIIVVVVFLSIFVGSLVMWNVRKKSIEAQSVLGEMDMSIIPYIVSVPPITAVTGEEYVYDVKYSDRDSEVDDISIQLTDAPSWLNVQGMSVMGIPPLGSEGQYKFTVKISDGRNSSIQENYILVQDNAE